MNISSSAGSFSQAEERPGDGRPDRGGLADDAPTLDVDVDVEVLPAVADHEDRFLDLLPDPLGFEDLERVIVDVDTAHPLSDGGPGHGLLALSGRLDDLRGFHRRAPE